MKKVLVFQLARLGDIIQSIPLLINLNKRNFFIDIVIDEKNIKICNDIPYINKIISFEIGKYLYFLQHNELESCYKVLKNFSLSLTKKKYDLVINLNHSDINRILVSFIQNGIKKGFKVGESSFINFLYSIIGKSRKLNPFNLVDIFNHFIDNPIIVKPKLSNNMKKIENLPNDYIIIHIGAGHKIRVLDFDIISKFIKIFLNKYNLFYIVLTGTKEEKNYINMLIKMLDKNYRKKIIDLSGKTDYYQLKYVINLSKIVISTDTGIMHLATALEKNIISIFFTSAFPFETGPYTENAIILTPNIDCYPCNEFNHCKYLKCKKLIKEDDILTACNIFLDNSNKNAFKNNNSIVYKPIFDSWGINLLDLTNRDILYRKRQEIRKQGISLC